MKSTTVPQPELAIEDKIAGHKVLHRRFENGRWLYGYMDPQLGLSWAPYDGPGHLNPVQMIQFEASILRYTPDIVAGEFANVGILIAQLSDDGSILDFRFRMVVHETHRLKEFFKDVWSDANWRSWSQAFLDRPQSLGAFEVSPKSFIALRNALYEATGHGCFSWSQSITGVEVSLDTAFDYYCKTLIFRNSN